LPSAVANLDEVIKLIRAAKDPVTAKEQLMARACPPPTSSARAADRRARPKGGAGKYSLSEDQAKRSDLRLHRLTGLERDKLIASCRRSAGHIVSYLENPEFARASLRDHARE